MRTAVAVNHILQFPERDGHPRADVVAERNRTEKARAVDAKLFAHGQRRGHHGRAGMRLRRRMSVVGFVGMRQHAVAQRRLDRSAHDIRSDHRRDLLALVEAREIDRELAGRQLRAGDHGG